MFPNNDESATAERAAAAPLLIDAVLLRQRDLAQRLACQLAHRHGVEALETFLVTSLLQTCGGDGVAWLREQLKQQPAAHHNPSAQAMGSLLRDAVDEALAPLRNHVRCQVSSQQIQTESMMPLRLLKPKPTRSSTPAPLPSDLDALRSWLHSDAA